MGIQNPTYKIYVRRNEFLATLFTSLGPSAPRPTDDDAAEGVPMPVGSAVAVRSQHVLRFARFEAYMRAWLEAEPCYDPSICFVGSQAVAIGT